MRWETPPPHGNRGQKRGKSAYSDEVAELKASPGKWALLRESRIRGSVTGLGYGIRTGRYPAFRPAGSFEATEHYDRESGTYRLYVRYIAEGGN